MHAPAEPYRGRFAPSPSGALHFGSLVAAVGSCLEARARGGEWLLRMEDLDAPRNVRGASHDILRTLERFGFEWDGAVLYQSARGEHYAAALDALRSGGLAYACACSRREIADSALTADGSRRYPGTCREGLPPGRAGRAWRLRVEPGEVAFVDQVQGGIAEDVASAVGDFVLLRADGVFAYQLAVVVDDAAQGISHVVRGADLLHSTVRQIGLQRALGLPTPAYAHLPAATNGRGEKLSKQTLAPSIAGERPQAALLAALAFLGQQSPAELAHAGLAELWDWAREHWDMARVPQRRSALAPAQPGGRSAGGTGAAGAR